MPREITIECFDPTKLKAHGQGYTATTAKSNTNNYLSNSITAMSSGSIVDGFSFSG